MSRDSVQVVLRDSTSTSPDCSAVKRFCAVVGTKRTLLGVAEDGGGDGAAVVDVEAAPDALAVRLGEAGEAGVHAADQRAAGADRIEGLAAAGRRLLRLGRGQEGRGPRPIAAVPSARAKESPKGCI